MEMKLRKAIETLCPDVEEQIREDFFSRMDPEYFSLFSPAQIADHLRMTAGLNPEHLVACTMTPSARGRLNIVITAYDYFSEFSIICGLLTSYGLDIESGHIFTFSDAGKSLPPAEKKKILDFFKVKPLKGFRFHPAVQEKFKNDLNRLVYLLDQNQIPEARGEINGRVVKFLSKTAPSMMGRLYPVNIKFDNHLSKKWTVLEIHSKNTPAFLYAFSNALSLRGIYIYKVRIESRGQNVFDQIFISHSRGNKIKRGKDQEILRIASVLTKQFTYFLPLAPNPAKGIQFFDQLLEKVMEKGLSRSVVSFLNRRDTLDLLARLLGTSEFLWEDFLRMKFDELLPILKNFKREKLLINQTSLTRKLKAALSRITSPDGQKKILNEFKDREIFRIDMKHLLAPQSDLTKFSRALTELSEIILEEAYVLSYRRLSRQYGPPMLENKTVCPFAICGLGKFGGREMGYASDIELLFVYGGEGETRAAQAPAITNQEFFERLGQEILNMIEAKREGIFQVDLRLRPYGTKGSLSNSIAYLKSYYTPHGGAAPFERQALTKLRRVAGDQRLGRQVEAVRDRFTYSGQPWDLKTALDLRQRQIKELIKPGTINVKYSPGGVIDIEYAAQYFQVQHGRSFPDLRKTSTLEALKGLQKAGMITQKEEDRLRQAYLFLRTLIDALRIVRGNARDLILPDRKSEEFKFLARRMGYVEYNWEAGAKALDASIGRHMKYVQQFFRNHFGKI